MKRTILTVITLAALAITAVQAQQSVPVSPTPQPGSPGTATPTPELTFLQSAGRNHGGQRLLGNLCALRQQVGHQFELEVRGIVHGR